MSKKITIDEVKKLAELSKIKLSDAELEKFVEDFSEILNYVEKLNEVDVSGLEPTSQVTGLVNVFRKDEARQSPASKEDLLNLAPKSDDVYILTNGVF